MFSSILFRGSWRELIVIMFHSFWAIQNPMSIIKKYVYIILGWGGVGVRTGMGWGGVGWGQYHKKA